MKGWIIFGCILFVFWLIGMIRANIEVCYSDSVRVAVKVLGIRFVITPKKKKTPKLSKFTPKKYRKQLAKDEAVRRKKEAKKAKKQAQKEAKAAEKKKAAEAKQQADEEGGAQSDQSKKKKKKKKRQLADLIEWVLIGLDALKGLGKSFGKHFEIEAVKMKIAVGTEDAAQTAILYGIIVQMAAYLVEGLSAITNFRCKHREEMEITADFLSDKLVMDLHFIFKIRVWHLFAMIFAAIGAAVKRMIKNAMQSQNPEQSVG